MYRAAPVSDSQRILLSLQCYKGLFYPRYERKCAINVVKLSSADMSVCQGVSHACDLAASTMLNHYDIIQINVFICRLNNLMSVNATFVIQIK